MFRTFIPITSLIIFLLAGCAPARPLPSSTSTSIPFIASAPTETLLPAGAVTPLPAASYAPLMSYMDIPYEQIEGVAPGLLSLDIYAPPEGGPHPVIVMIHGGSWRDGDKNTDGVSGIKSLYFISQGYVFVSINYRLAPDARHPSQVQDVAAALAWVHTYIDHYGGDAGRLYVMGHSSGGQLAALVATDERYLAAHGLGLDILGGIILLDAVGVDIPRSVTPKNRAVYENAFGTNPDVWREASPLYHVAPGKGIPPFLIFYSGQREDTKVTGQELADALTGAGIKNWLVPELGKDHNTITGDVGTPGDPVTARIMEFLEDTKP